MKAKLMYKTENQLVPQRGSSTGLFIPRPRTDFLKKSFSYSGAKVWNRIPENILNSISYNSFCKTFSPRPPMPIIKLSSLVKLSEYLIAFI